MPPKPNDDLLIPLDLARQVTETLTAHDEERKRNRDNAEKARGSLLEFMKMAWPIMEPTRPLVDGFHVQAICEHLQACHNRQIRKLLINISPGSAKSLFTCVGFPAWVWAKDPGFRGTFASYGAELSTRDSVRCRDLMQSSWYQETFEPTWKFSSVQNEKTYYTNTHKGFRVSTSVGGRGTGWRGTALIIDDPHNINDEYSDKKYEEVIHWWDNVVFNRLDNMDTGLKIIIMQRISDRDLAAHFLREGGVEHLMIPNEYEPERSKVTSLGWRDPRTERGELMCPALLSRAVTDEFKTKPDRYHGQYQQNPHPEGSGILKPHLWNYWKPAGLNLPPVRVRMPDGKVEEREAVDLPNDFDLILQGWDFAFKDLKSSDYVAGEVAASHGPNRYLLDAIHDRMDIIKSVNAVRKMSGHGWGSKAHLKLIEGKANGPAVMQTLKDEIGGLVEVEPQGGKVARVRAASYEQSTGNWYLPHPALADWVGDPANPSGGGGFMQECTAFPNGAFDDFPDCWSMLANRIKTEKDGAIYKASEQSILVQPHEIPKTWKRVYGMCVTWNEIAAVWLAHDPQTSNFEMTGEYWAVPTDPALHVKEIRERGAWIPGVISAMEDQRERRDGYLLAEKYVNLGLRLDATPEIHSATVIVDLNNALNQGKLKIFGNVSKFFDQYRMYRRDPKGKLPLHNVALMRALETAWQWGHERMRAETPTVVPVAPIELGRSMRDGGAGWMAG